MGPLKKRRKKKRKGSSSSESSCQQSNPATNDQHGSLLIQTQLSPANSSKSSHQNVLSPVIYLDDGQKSLNMVKIKQEVIDSPSYPTAAPSIDSDTKNIPIYQAAPLNQNQNHLHHHQQQQQIMPINLATETRGGIANRPTSTITAASAFEHVVRTTPPTMTMTNSNNNNAATNAVKNLTPKIMELAVETTPVVPISSSPPPGQTTIKQEVGVDDYNTANIFCKKVLKAQQTKGVWPNSPTSNRISASRTSLPIITTTASTPPPVPASVVASPTNNSTLDSSSTTAAGIVTNYSMGPPAQMAPSTSPNNSSLQEDAMGQPKVVSRNLQQLRAKKLLSVNPATCDPPDLSVVKDAADLPENLGLPRERVISICNMDKHELDDYFLPVEEENSEDQETELLQYFQMGDAEEKLTKNSSSDAKRNSYSTVPIQMMSSQLTSTTLSVTMSSGVQLTTAPITTTTTTSAAAARQMLTMIQANRRGGGDSSLNGDNNSCKSTKQLSQQAINYLKSTHLSSSSLNHHRAESNKQQLSSKPATTSAVGTASASLEQITQHKHQQQNLLQNQTRTQTITTTVMSQGQNLQQTPQPPTKVSYKRKINLNTTSSSSDITAARKNYSFLPISPNINTTSNTSSYAGSTNATGSHNNAGFFASPGFNRLLTKQQSLDCESSSDPMIGATRRRRPFMSTVTSASAPPSPSVLKQQQEQHIFALSHNILLDQWSSSNNSSTYHNNSAANHSNAAVLVDQNSLDLDLFGEAAAVASSATSTCGSLLSGNGGGRRHINNNSNNCGTISSFAENNIANNNDSIINDFTQRSRSVPLSQLQRSHSPSFNRAFHMTTGGGSSSTAYSACNSLAQTPVPSEFIDSVTMLSENSCSQQSASMKLEEVGNMVGSDSTALLDEVDVSDILSSPDFVTKFSNIVQTGGAGAKTSCSSAGSSSGYSSTGQFSLSLSSYGSNSGGVTGGAISSSASVSRSVPSTPLPHHNAPNLLGNGSNSYRRRFGNSVQPLNNSGGLFISNFSSSGKYGYGNMNSALSKSAFDISKSMPSTPITTTPSSFRYSPSDFLINGNTIDDSIASSFGTVGGDNLMGSDVVGVDVPLHSDSLLHEEDSLVNGLSDINQSEDVISPALVRASGMLGVANNTGGESPSSSSVVIGVGSDILDNL